MKPLAKVTTLGLGLLLSACSMVGPDYHLPRDSAMQRKDLQGSIAGESDNVVSAPVPADWWRLYQDPQLNELVRQALASNTDLRVAAASLARARAQVEEAEAAGGFSAGIKAGAQRLQESGQAFLLAEKVPVANVADISLSASYQFDLWGTLQRGIEAAKANADATQAAGDVARITLVADVVRSYTQVCAANEEREIAEHSLDLQAESTELTKRLRDAGRGDETQVTRSQTQFKSLRAELPRYTAARQAGLYRLSMLLAKPVDQLPAGVADCAALPHIAQLLPVGDGAELLKRRPDIRGHGRLRQRPRRAVDQPLGLRPGDQLDGTDQRRSRAYPRSRSHHPGRAGAFRRRGAQRHPRDPVLADLQATRTYTDVRAQLASANTQVAMSQIDLFLALGGGWESGRTPPG